MKQDKDMEKILISILVVIIVIGGFLIWSYRNQPNVYTPRLLGEANSPAMGLNSSSTVTSTVKLVLAAFSGAQARIITNCGGPDLYIGVTTTGLVSSTAQSPGVGLLMKGSTTQIFGEAYGLNWVGAFYGIANGTTTLCAVQW